MDISSHMTEQDLDRVAAYLALDASSTPYRVDIAFLFGTRYPDPAQLAADLYQRGVVRRIVVTGGRNRHTGICEARAHEAILLQAGVPGDRIVVDDASTNTLENVVNGVSKLRATIDLGSLTSVVVVAKWFHCRRAVMTLKRHMPSGVRYYVEAYVSPDVPRHEWQLRDDSRARVLKEWERIPQYLRLDHLAELAFQDGAYV